MFLFLLWDVSLSYYRHAIKYRHPARNSYQPFFIRSRPGSLKSAPRPIYSFGRNTTAYPIANIFSAPPLPLYHQPFRSQSNGWCPTCFFLQIVLLRLLTSLALFPFVMKKAAHTLKLLLRLCIPFKSNKDSVAFRNSHGGHVNITGLEGLDEGTETGR